MNPVDAMLISSILAASFIVVCSILAESRLRLQSTFIGKKYAYTIHLLLLVFSVLQVVGVSIIAAYSTWTTGRVPSVGYVICLMGIVCFVLALKRYGISRLTYRHVFKDNNRQHVKYPIWPHPVIYAVAIVYVGLALALGKVGFYLASLCIVVVAWLTSCFLSFTVKK